MSEKEKLQKFDLVNTTNKFYDNTLQYALTSGSSVITTVLDFFFNSLLYPMKKYNMYDEDRLINYAMELETKARRIPYENLVQARVNILGPTMDGLKYNLDEEHTKEMFTNILISDMDNRKQRKVLPSYIEIVKQLSRNDMAMLKFIKERNIKDAPIAKLKYNLVNGDFVFESNNIGLIYNNKYNVLNPMIVNNLTRLKLITLHFNNEKHNKTTYKKAFEKARLKDEFRAISRNVKDLNIFYGSMELTDLGQNFIDICIT